MDVINNTVAALPNSSATPLIFLTAKYATLNENAVNQGFFTINNNQLFDVANSSAAGKYIAHDLFGAAPINAVSKTNGAINLQLNPNLIFSNCNKTITQVYIDFLDGLGYQILTTNVNLIKTYTNSSGYKKFNIKAIHNDGSVLYCQSQQYVQVNAVATIANGRYATLSQAQLNNPTYNFQTGPNQFAKVYIQFSKKRIGTSLANQIVKPFIVVEGYDIHDVAPKLAEENYDVNKLIKEWVNLEQNFGYNFNGNLDDTAGYDLIFVDYYTMDFIQNNARMLERVIDSINANKVNNAQGVREKNVVMGISMGGLVSRYCLAQMTKEGKNTDTRMLFTMDSPHQGANVPIGLQHLLYDFGEMTIVTAKIKSQSDVLKQFYILNNQPATQNQLLIRVLDGAGNRINNTFLATGGVYRQMVDFTPAQLVATPPSYVFKAISQGSECGVNVMQPNSSFINYEENISKFQFFMGVIASSKYKLTAQVKALPNYGETNVVAYTKFQRRISFFFGLIGTGWVTTFENSRTSPTNTIPWDCVPGGTQSISGRNGSFGDNSLTPKIKNTSFFESVLGVLAYPFFHVRVNFAVPYQQDIFCFVPITSALDVSNVDANSFNRSRLFPVDGLAGSKSVKYIAQEKFINTIAGQPISFYNTNHTDFSKRNAEWIFREMQNLPNDVDCGQYVSCENPPQIFVESEECNGIKIFNISNKTSFTNIQWSVLPAGAAVLENITQNRVRVKARHNIPYTLQVTYNFCNNVNILIQASFTNIVTETKGVEITDVSLTGSTWCASTDHQFIVNDFGEGAIYNWSLGAGLTLVSTSIDGKTIIVNYAGGATSFPTINCVVTNAYCYQDNTGSKLILNLGDVTDAQLKTTYGAWQSLLPTNFVSDNHAYTKVIQPGVDPSGVTYSLASGSAVPEVWGSYATNQLQMFVYNRSAGTYNFNANIFNADCGTYTNIPFTINLSGTGGSFGYQKVFYVAPNPVSNVTSVGVNQNAPTKQFINACIAAGGQIRVEVRNFNGVATAPYIFNSSPFSTTVNNINMQTKPTGIYFFTITAQGCPNNGVYQEVHQVQKL